MDTTQVILIAIVIVLAILLVAIGVQAFFVLRDLRKSLVRANMVFDEVEDIVERIKSPIETLGSVATGLTTGVGIAHFLKKIHEKSKEKDEK